MHATMSAAPARPSLGRKTKARSSETGSRGDHLYLHDRRWHQSNNSNSNRNGDGINKISKISSLKSAQESTDQILHYYYYESSTGDAPEEMSSNDDVALSTTALQGHQHQLTSTHLDPAFHRSGSVNSSSSGTISFPVQPARAGTGSSQLRLYAATTADKRYSVQPETNKKTAAKLAGLLKRNLSTNGGDVSSMAFPFKLAASAHSAAVDDHRDGRSARVGAVPASAPPIQNAFIISDPSSTLSHHRSASDIQGQQQQQQQQQQHQQHKRGRSSRDIGIVGSVPTIDLANDAQVAAADPGTARLTLPLFQTPRSRSPSPSVFAPSASAASAHLHPTWRADDAMSDHSDLDDTPTKPALKGAHPDTPRNSIERERERDKQRHSYSARLAFKPTQAPSLSYLYYQPGLHSTAGPLPSPPRRIYTSGASNPPPRPPRLAPQSRPASSERQQSPVLLSPEAAAASQLQLSTPASSDYSLTAVSVLTSENEQSSQDSPPKSEAQYVPSSQAESTSSTDKSFYTSNHTREGAFASGFDHATKSSSKTDLKDINDDHSADDRSSSSPVSHSNHSPPPDPTQSESKAAPPSPRSLTSEPDVLSPPSSPSSYGSSSEGQPKLQPLPLSLERQSSLKRPSPPPRPLLPEPILDTFYQHIPSPLTVDLPNKPFIYPSTHFDPKRPPSEWPEAMNFKEILVLKSSKERALAYNIKFRELMLEETGLRDWLNSVGKKDRPERTNNITVSLTPALSPIRQQTRHVSRGSIASEATFPIRQDAYTATDLMSKPVADMPSSITAPPSLPYPSLAQGIGVRKRSSRNLSVETPLVSPAVGSARALSGGGFFASIGRKASLRKERTLQPVSPGKHPGSLLQPPPQTRVVKLEHAPTLPGGPRAPPRSAHRASTIVYPRGAKDSASLLSKRHSVSPARRSEESHASFDRRLEMMADLLPQTDKPVLSAYLRRAQNNDPMVAISDYLEDAKQNDVRVS